MKEYIERAVAIERARNELDLINKSHWSADEIVDFLKRLPAADVVEVVRCPECVHHVDCGYHFCNMWCANCPDDSDFFCAYGERDGGVKDAAD